MTDTGIYSDIAKRCGGNIYIGVVGPVRTGKSTFIKRFMEELVLPSITDEGDRERARDEMPQSAAGRTVMTTEPKFVPDEAVTLSPGAGAVVSVRMADCVGFIVPEAIGHIENGGPRMVMTPWSAEPMPFAEAAEIGTRKVIGDHSTVGAVVTTDGSIGEIPRESYIEAERRTVSELKKLGKPFAIILNSAHPNRADSIELAESLETEYGAPVALVNCLELEAEDIVRILELMLREFPVSELAISFPQWVASLPDDHPIPMSLAASASACASAIRKTSDVETAVGVLLENEYVTEAETVLLDYGTGKARVRLTLDPALYCRTLGELTGFDIPDNSALFSLLASLAAVKVKYDRIAQALDEALTDGYGIVMPGVEDLRLCEPEIVRQSGGYGVKLKASGMSLHIIRAEIETEINPTVGTEQQSEELVHRMLEGFGNDPARLWESNMFGKTLSELVGEGLNAKLSHMPDDAREKIARTLQRIINEASGGLICILL